MWQPLTPPKKEVTASSSRETLHSGVLRAAPIPEQYSICSLNCSLTLDMATYSSNNEELLSIKTTHYNGTQSKLQLRMQETNAGHFSKKAFQKSIFKQKYLVCNSF